MPRVFPLLMAIAAAAAAQIYDPRNIRAGMVIPDEGYSDQPYIVKTDDGAWLVVVTTGKGMEGEGGQHVITRRSTDMGKTWPEASDVEPATGPEASYAVLLKVPTGRLYVFYNHNTDNVRKVIADNPPYKDGFCYRVDSLGHFVFKYSDDHGRSWSAKRYDIPMRDFQIDSRNPYQGKLKFFWTVGKAFIHSGAGYVPIHKVGGFGDGFFTSSEGALLRGGNILTERDPEKIRWETLPDGEVGIRAPPGGGPVAEEHSFSLLSDGSIFCVYRTIDGHPARTYSRDGGRTWETPEYMRYDDGRLMKHPRAANFAWRCENGRFLYWFHNHGGRFIREHPRRRTIAYEDRNPVWLSGGVEGDSPRGKIIRWSQPEIVLYDDDPIIRMSYPDLVQEGGRYFLTETQKDIARVHDVDPALIEGLWGQFDNQTAATKGLVLNLPGSGGRMPEAADAPEFPVFIKRSTRFDHGTEDMRAGFSIDLFVRLRSLDSGQVLLDNRTPEGKGLVLRTVPKGAIEIVINDGRTDNAWDSGPGWLQAGKLQHVAVVVDGGPKIISFIIDGKFCDGGDDRQFGWGRFSAGLMSANGGRTLRIAQDVLGLRLYHRSLRTSEAIGNFRAGPPPASR